MAIRVSALYCLVIVGAFCQPAPDYSHFEVAAVKPSPPKPNLPLGAVPAPDIRGGPGSTSPQQINYGNVSLMPLVLMAFNIRPMQLVAPKSTGRPELFDISATLPAGANKEQLGIMLQNLLAERFHLKVHHENRILPVYAMTVGKNGLKLKESSTEPAPPIATGTSIGKLDAEGFLQFPPGYSGIAGMPSNGRMRTTGQKVTLVQLAGWVEPRMDHPIVDQTGLSGEYDFKIEHEWMQRAGTPAGDPTDAAPSVPQALEKLGLKLELKQLPFDVLVIDQLDKVPTEN